MADQRTINVYNESAAHYAKEWAEQPAPNDMYALLLKYFKPGETADIGCGSGRDSAWLSKQGFPVRGYDNSEGLLKEARSLHPNIEFIKSELPALDGILAESFENVLCETVIMHLRVESIAPAVDRLRDILKKGGMLYLSWRITEGRSKRDGAGRLYSAFTKDLIASQFHKSDQVLFEEEQISASSSKKIYRLIVRRG